MSESAGAPYWEARLTGQFDLSGVGYLGLGRAYNGWLYRVRRRIFFRALGSAGVSAGRASVLDVGSGTGFYVEEWLRLHAGSVVGCGIAPVSVRELSRRYPAAAFHCVDIGRDAAPLGRAAYDVVSAFDVLFHIVDDAAFERALRNLQALLKPGGALILTDNFVHGAPSRSAHQVSRSLAHWEGVLRAAGFRIRRRAPAFVILNAPVDTTGALWPRVWHWAVRLVTRHEAMGWLAGAALYPLELVLTALLRESPTTEWMVCMKPRAEGGTGE